MTSQQIGHLTAAANEIGRAGKIICRYELNRRTNKFAWCFYRQGRLVASTSNDNEVIRKAERLVATK